MFSSAQNFSYNLFFSYCFCSGTIIFTDSMTVSTGVYTYPFEIELPDNLPTSCEGKYGFIRYLASVNIIRPNQPIQTQTIAFTVIKPHNLNASPLFQVSA